DVVRGRRGRRVEDDLDRAPAVAKVDEDQPAVVAAAADPAVQVDLAAGVRRAQGAGVGCAEAAHSPPPRPSPAPGEGETASASWSHGTRRSSPLAMSWSTTTRSAASSAFMITAQRAPVLSAARILARRLRRV